ncbi:orotate phosphoribosyltransferase [Nanoarchaeota archaeon]
MNITKILLEQKAVLLSPNKPFTWTSGIKSPIYCDNRKLISNVKARDIITNQLIKTLEKEDVDIIAGTATAGIPWASFIAQKLNKPLIYVRSKPKGHGTAKTIEGEFEKGKKVVIIEDLISTGKSSLNSVREVKNAGGIVNLCIGIFSYGFGMAVDGFTKENVKLVTLSDFTELVEEAIKENYIKKEDKEMLETWRKEFL